MPTSLLFYSNYCQNCKQIVREINKSDISHLVKYICIDNPGVREKLPRYINSVPSLVVGETNQIYVGNQILGWIKMQPLTQKKPSPHAPPSVRQHHQQQTQQRQTQATAPQQPQQVPVQNVVEPNAWHTNEMNAFSDMYSFIDVDTSAQGNGGMSMVHNFETLGVPPSNMSSKSGLTLPGGAPTSPNMPVQYGNPMGGGMNNNTSGYGSIQVSEKESELNKQMEEMMNRREMDVPNVPSRM